MAHFSRATGLLKVKGKKSLCVCLGAGVREGGIRDSLNEMSSLMFWET